MQGKLSFSNRYYHLVMVFITLCILNNILRMQIGHQHAELEFSFC